MAEKEGFEPSMELQTPYSLSRGAPSATRPFLQIFNVRKDTEGWRLGKAFMTLRGYLITHFRFDLFHFECVHIFLHGVQTHHAEH